MKLIILFFSICTITTAIAHTQENDNFKKAHPYKTRNITVTSGNTSYLA